MFLHLDPSRRALTKYLGGMVEQFAALGLDQLHSVGRWEWTIDCN